MKQKIIENIKRNFKLRNKSKINKKIIIAFSGVPGSGKTTIAKKLEQKYKGVRINNDKLGQIINNLVKKYQKDLIGDTRIYLEEYLQNLLMEYNYKNGLIILDSGIDRRYKQIKKIAALKGYELFIIRIKTTRENLEKRILKRNKENSKGYLDNLDKWFKDYKNCAKDLKANVILDNSKNLDIKYLFSMLDAKLK